MIINNKFRDLVYHLKIESYNSIKKQICFSTKSSPVKGDSKKKKYLSKAFQKFKKVASKKLANALLTNRVPTHFNIVINHMVKPIGLNMDKAILQIVEFHDRMIINHQVVEGTARFNSIRLYAIRMLEGQNPAPLDFVATGRKDKWPSAFDKLRPLYYRKRDLNCQISDQVIRSILYLNRLCDGNDVPDISEITKPFTISPEFEQRYESFINDKLPCTPYYSGELITRPSTRVLRNGPNRKPKWQTADVEAYALTRSEFADDFKALCFHTGNKDLYDYIVRIASKQDRPDRVRLRYITTIRDKGNKCRLVAISDYWTQVLLEPIMRETKSFIKERYRDLSSSDQHSRGFELLKQSIKPGIQSYDIKSWTDAFPAKLQHIFMKKMFGKDIADSWYNLVVSCKWDLKGSKSPIRYARGQGMGTAGSFDIATATDLLLLEMIYEQDYNLSIFKEKNLFNKTGDDLWCYDPEFKIRDTYTQKCGIDISVPKTKSATSDNLVAEYVSRSLNHGFDVSRISANICRAVKKNLLDLPELTRHLSERSTMEYFPVGELFYANRRMQDGLRYSLVRTLYLTTFIYPNRTGINLLKNSLERDFSDFIRSDDIINYIISYGRKENPFVNSYFLHSCLQLIEDIMEKSNAVFDSTIEFDSSDHLAESADPSIYWNTDDSINLMTSKMLLAESFRTHNMLYVLNTEEDYEQVFTNLQRIDQSMTFKELGVISTDKQSWRPKTTKLFNIVNKLDVLSFDCEGYMIDAKSTWNPIHLVVTSEEHCSMTHREYFGGTYRPVLGNALGKQVPAVTGKGNR